MKISGNAVRPGMIIQHQGRLWRASKIQHTQPGKGGAYLQVELKEIQTGTKLHERFRSAETVERVILDQRTYQYLYKEGSTYTFMDKDTYEQITLTEDDIGENLIPYLEEGMEVQIDSYEEKPIGVSIPEKVVCLIEDTESVIKGQTASSSYKPARLTNGIKTSVPPHIAVGDKVVINTEDGSYVEKVKE